MTYAKLISETAIDRNPPRSAVIDGRTVCGRLPADYLATLGYYPLVETPAPPPEEGCHVEPRYACDDAEDPSAVVQSWAQVADPPPPPRVFSKMKVVLALREMGVWPQVKAWIEAQDLYDVYLAAQDFREDDPYFAQGLAALKSQLGITDGQAEAILSDCEVPR